MKPSIIILAVLAAVVAAALIVVGMRKPAAAPAQTEQPAAASANTQPPPSPEMVAVPKPAPVAASQKPNEAAPVPTATAVAQEPTAVGKAVDGLLSAKSGVEKHDLFQQIVKAGQIDAVIADLKQRMAANPNDASIPTTLGEAQLNKLRDARANGATRSEIGIMAMEADQSFDAALKVDPQNWEAQEVKYTSMSRWPADPQMDADVVQHLSGLIDQQETMPSQPEFAATYVTLGDEYQKLGQADKAAATWRLGAQKFPSDSTLQKRVSGQ